MKKVEKFNKASMLVLCFIALLMASSCMNDRTVTSQVFVEETNAKKVLNKSLVEYELFRINEAEVWYNIKSNLENGVNLKLPISSQPDWEMFLNKEDVFAEDFTFGLIGANNEISYMNHPEMYFLGGHIKGSSSLVALSMGADIPLTAEIYIDENNLYVIESANNFDNNLPTDLIVMYHSSHVIADALDVCDVEGGHLTEENYGSPMSNGNGMRNVCRQIPTTYLGDYGLYQAMGWSSAAGYMSNRMYYANKRYWGYNGHNVNLPIRRGWLYSFPVTIASSTTNKAQYVQEWQDFGNRNWTWFQPGDLNILFHNDGLIGVSPNRVYGRAKGIGHCCVRPGESYAFQGRFSHHGAYQENNRTAHELGHLMGCHHNGTWGFMKVGMTGRTHSMTSTTHTHLTGHFNFAPACHPGWQACW